MKKVLTFFFFATFIATRIQAQCWESVAACQFHSLAIKTNGTLWAWGENNALQLGDGTNANKNIPTEISPCPINTATSDISHTNYPSIPQPDHRLLTT